jgi:hypothetical protein
MLRLRSRTPDFLITSDRSECSRDALYTGCSMQIVSDTNTERNSGDINVPSSLVAVRPYFPSRRAAFIRFRGKDIVFLYPLHSSSPIRYSFPGSVSCRCSCVRTLYVSENANACSADQMKKQRLSKALIIMRVDKGPRSWSRSFRQKRSNEIRWDCEGNKYRAITMPTQNGTHTIVHRTTSNDESIPH